MMPFRIKLSKGVRASIEKKLKQAQESGDLQTVKRMLAILSLGEGENPSRIGQILKVSTEAIRQWVVSYLTRGLKGLVSGKKPGPPAEVNEESTQGTEPIN